MTWSEASPGRVNDVCLLPSRVGTYACAGVGIGVGIGADTGSGGDPEDDGGVLHSVAVAKPHVFEKFAITY